MLAKIIKSIHTSYLHYWWLLLVLMLIVTSQPTLADADKKPLTTITMFGIAGKTARHIFDYSHVKPIGICMWWKFTWLGPTIYFTPEMDEYLPDLVVSVYNHPGDNPFTEASLFLDSIAHPIASMATQASTGMALGEGATASRKGAPNQGLKTKYVDVIGHPLSLVELPFISLKPDTKAFFPYYQSSMDLLSRLGVAEMLRYETYLPFSNYIGKSRFNHWGYEFPRSMSVTVDNNYKVSVIAALRAADIVTNKNLLHVVKDTNNSCGKNCAVDSVIEETDEKHVIWQEVYPNDRKIILGEDETSNTKDKSKVTSKSPASLGADDEAKGGGRYVFVLWRHYRGCIQGKNFIMATTNVPPTTKR